MENVIGTVGDSDGHLLIENINKTGIHCHFCLLRGVKKKTIWLHRVLHCFSFSRRIKVRYWGIRGHDLEHRKTITQGYEQKVKVRWRYFDIDIFTLHENPYNFHLALGTFLESCLQHTMELESYYLDQDAQISNM